MNRKKEKHPGRAAPRKVHLWSSLQTKFALTYIVVIAAVVVLLNTYPVLASRNMVFQSKQAALLNQASTDRLELARLLNISDNQLSYITNVEFGRGLIKCGSAIVPFMDNFPKHTQLYQWMTTKPSDLTV